MSSPPPTSFPHPVFFGMARKTDLTHSGSACVIHMDPCLSFVSTDTTWSGQNSKWTCQTHGYDTAPTTVNPPRVLFSNIPEHLVGSIIFSLSCIYSGVLHVITTTGSCTTILSLLLCTKSPCKHPVYSAILSSVARRLDLNSWDWPGLIYSMWLWLAPFVPMWESSLLFYLLTVLAAVPLFTFLLFTFLLSLLEWWSELWFQLLPVPCSLWIGQNLRLQQHLWLLLESRSSAESFWDPLVSQHGVLWSMGIMRLKTEAWLHRRHGTGDGLGA